MYISNYLNATLTPLVVYRGAISRAAIDDGEKHTRASRGKTTCRYERSVQYARWFCNYRRGTVVVWKTVTSRTRLSTRTRKYIEFGHVMASAETSRPTCRQRIRARVGTSCATPLARSVIIQLHVHARLCACVRVSGWVSVSACVCVTRKVVEEYNGT